jgi:hypothetical protein
MAEAEQVKLEQVLKALGNPHWDWRTLSGLAAEAHLPEREVRMVIGSLGSIIERGKTSENQEVYRLRPLGKEREGTDKAMLWQYITKSGTSSSGSSGPTK